MRRTDAARPKFCRGDSWLAMPARDHIMLLERDINKIFIKDWRSADNRRHLKEADPHFGAVWHGIAKGLMFWDRATERKTKKEDVKRDILSGE